MLVRTCLLACVLYSRLTTLFQQSYPHTREQNGGAERKHHDILNTTHIILLSTSVPPTFWADVVPIILLINIHLSVFFVVSCLIVVSTLSPRAMIFVVPLDVNALSCYLFTSMTNCSVMLFLVALVVPYVFLGISPSTSNTVATILMLVMFASRVMLSLTNLHLSLLRIRSLVSS